MLQKNTYEPKDARIMSYYEDDQDDDDLSDLGILDPSRPGTSRKKKTTGTQALAEFLSTTSPEEFQRNQKGTTNFSSTSPSPVTEPSSTNFFRLRKSKRQLAQRHNTTDLVNNLAISSTSALVTMGPSSSSIMSTTSTQSVPSITHKKNYIEIIPKAIPPTSQQQQQQSLPSSPMLPQMGQHKKRESSLYSGSLRYSASIKSQLSGGGATTGHKVGRPLTRQDTTTTLLSMASGQTNNSLHKKQLHGMIENAPKESMAKNKLDDQQKKNLTQSFLSGISQMDIVEAGLVQRLERCKLAGYEKPSDKVASSLANEHVCALDVSFHQEQNGGKCSDISVKATTKIRHAQVQTMPLEDDELQTPSISLPSNSKEFSPATTVKTQSPMTTMDQLEKQLAEEREHRQRLQASLNETKDHFEVLSGLAYKKLREIWEEKLRWENTCMQLNEQLNVIQQQQGNANSYQQHYDEMEENSLALDKENQLTLSVVS